MPKLFGVSLVAVVVIVVATLYINRKYPGNPVSSLVMKVP